MQPPHLEGQQGGASLKPPVERVREILLTQSSGRFRGRTYITMPDLLRWLGIDAIHRPQVQPYLSNLLRQRGWTATRIRPETTQFRAWLKPLPRVSK